MYKNTNEKTIHTKVHISFIFTYSYCFILFTFYCFYKNKKCRRQNINDVSKIPYNKVDCVGTCKTMKDKKTINPFWKYGEAAYELWKAKKIDRILISGDNG